MTLCRIQNLALRPSLPILMPEPFCNAEPSNDLGRAFLAAVKNRDALTLDQLLTANAELREQIDVCWFSFDSPAIVSAKSSESIVKVLLKHGADINARSEWWAGSFGVLDGVSAETAQFLVDRGARYDIHSAAEQGRADLVQEFLDRDAELVNARGGDGMTPLHVASTIEVCDVLLEAGGDASIRCLDHSATAAQYQVSRPEVCRHLILNGAEPDIYMACAIGDRELVQQLIQENEEVLDGRIGSCPHTAPVHERSHNHIYCWKLLGAQTALEVAREFDQTDLYRELYQRSCPEKQFIAALWEADRADVSRLTQEIPDLINRLDAHESQIMTRAAWDGKLESVELMLDAGFDPHLAGAENSTPLDRAAFHGFQAIVELLLARDPNPPLEFKNGFGGTPLSCCAYGATHSWKQGTNHLGTALALIKAGAKIEADWLPIEDPEIDALFRKHLGLSNP